VEFSVLEAWAHLRRGELQTQLEVRRKPQHVLMWRRLSDITFRALGDPEHAFMAGIAAGRTCADAGLAAVALDAHFDVAAGFASLLHEHLLMLEHEQQQEGS
jgi:hypothetical protein